MQFIIRRAGCKDTPKRYLPILTGILIIHRDKCSSLSRIGHD